MSSLWRVPHERCGETKMGAARQEQRPWMMKLLDCYCGFGTTRSLFIALRSHAAQSLAWLLLATFLAVQPAKCSSGNDTNDFPGRGIVFGFHLVLLKFDLDSFGLLTPAGHCLAVGLWSISISL